MVYLNLETLRFVHDTERQKPELGKPLCDKACSKCFLTLVGLPLRANGFELPYKDQPATQFRATIPSLPTKVIDGRPFETYLKGCVLYTRNKSMQILDQPDPTNWADYDERKPRGFSIRPGSEVCFTFTTGSIFRVIANILSVPKLPLPKKCAPVGILITIEPRGLFEYLREVPNPDENVKRAMDLIQPRLNEANGKAGREREIYVS